jgi:hypothetical protein
MKKDITVCDCQCHRQKQTGLEIKHIGPCCDVCYLCQQNIRRGMINVHKEACPKNAQNGR